MFKTNRPRARSPAAVTAAEPAKIASHVSAGRVALSRATGGTSPARIAYPFEWT